jgi:hypothetical protein
MILKDARNNNFSMLIAQLIAAKLNTPNLLPIIVDAENWLCNQLQFQGQWWNTPFSKIQKQIGTNYKNALDYFNNTGTY